MKKKILFVITKSNWGGAQRYVYDLATSFKKMGSEIKVVFGGTGEADASHGVLATNLSLAGIKGIFLPSFMRDISFSREWEVLHLLVEIFTKEKPAVVHLNSSKAGGLGAVAARLVGVPRIIFTVHGWPFLEDRPIIVKVLIWLASWFTVLFCHKVICISEYDLQIAKRMPFMGDKAVRIYNGIAPMSFGMGEKIRDAFPAGVRITGTIGELNKNKNQIALVEQAKNDPGMYVAIVGEGEDRVMLEAKIKEYGLEGRVKLFGFMPVSEVLRGFDIFSLPSLKEGLPYVLLEAKAAGLPVVANRVGGIGEILDTKDMNEFSLEQMIQKTAELYR